MARAPLLYAIGDVHGEREALAYLVDQIERDSAGRGKVVVLLGDYIDRGPDSAGALALARSLSERPDYVCLRGNHENMALGRADYPADDLAWMETRPLYHHVEGVLFVHAGVRPGVPLAEQSPRDLMWIRGDFLDHDGSLGVPGVSLVVHGHTPVSEPERSAHSINIDTGAAMGGPLTALALEDGKAPRCLFWKPERLPAWAGRMPSSVVRAA